MILVISRTEAQCVALQAFRGDLRTSLVILGVLDEVVLEDPHENGRQEARQQQHCHAAVDDGEPMNLRQRKRLLHTPCQTSVRISLLPSTPDGDIQQRDTAAGIDHMIALRVSGSKVIAEGRALTSRCCGRKE